LLLVGIYRRRIAWPHQAILTTITITITIIISLSLSYVHVLQGEKSNYSLWEFSMFLLVGVLGGLIGATFNYLNGRVNLFRRTTPLRTIQSFKLVEVILITAVMSSITCVLPYLWTKCTPLPVDMKGWSSQEKALVLELNPLYCPAETHYNELASLWLTDSDGAIKQLFHFREIGDHKVSTFSSASLFLFAVPYVAMMCVTAGSAVPAGLFVPSLLSGAAFGRLVGHILHKADQTRGTFADSGTYALMGSAAVTGGVTRITISLTLMILEATGDMQYVLPLMLTVMAASMVGNVFTKSIYEQHIESRHLHHLDEEESISNLVYFYDWTVSNVMTPDPECVRPVARVGELLEKMQRTSHHCFPVVATADGEGGRRVFIGTITRKVICTLMKHRAFAPPSVDPRSAERLSPLVNWGTLECIYPNYPNVSDLDPVSTTEAECWLDLRPYIDAAAFCVNEHATIQRAYRMFRTLGLRHLCVVDHSNAIQGVITRADLADLVNEAEELEEEAESEAAAALLPGDGDGDRDDVDGAAGAGDGSAVKRRRGGGGRFVGSSAHNHTLKHTIAPDIDLEASGLPPSPSHNGKGKNSGGGSR
jgi:chloride channel 7